MSLVGYLFSLFAAGTDSMTQRNARFNYSVESRSGSCPALFSQAHSTIPRTEIPSEFRTQPNVSMANLGFMGSVPGLELVHPTTTLARL